MSIDLIEIVVKKLSCILSACRWLCRHPVKKNGSVYKLLLNSLITNFIKRECKSVKACVYIVASNDVARFLC